MNDFTNAVIQARSDIWRIIEKAYSEIQSKDNKLVEYIYLHLIKTIPHSKIRLGERWIKNKAIKDKLYLEIEKDYTIFINVEDRMDKYYKEEDDINELKKHDKLYISAHISNTQSMCCDAVILSELTLDKLTNKINEMVQHLKEHLEV